MATFGRRHIIAIANGFIAAKPPEPLWGNTDVAKIRYAASKGMLIGWKDTIAFISAFIKDSDPEFSEDEFLAMIMTGRKVKDDA